MSEGCLFRAHLEKRFAQLVEEICAEHAQALILVAGQASSRRTSSSNADAAAGGEQQLAIPARSGDNALPADEESAVPPSSTTSSPRQPPGTVPPMLPPLDPRTGPPMLSPLDRSESPARQVEESAPPRCASLPQLAQLRGRSSVFSSGSTPSGTSLRKDERPNRRRNSNVSVLSGASSRTRESHLQARLRGASHDGQDSHGHATSNGAQQYGQHRSHSKGANDRLFATFESIPQEHNSDSEDCSRSQSCDSSVSPARSPMLEVLLQATMNQMHSGGHGSSASQSTANRQQVKVQSVLGRSRTQDGWDDDNSSIKGGSEGRIFPGSKIRPRALERQTSPGPGFKVDAGERFQFTVHESYNKAKLGSQHEGLTNKTRTMNRISAEEWFDQEEAVAMKALRRGPLGCILVEGISPSAKKRLVWDGITILFIMWDVVTIPMQFLNLEHIFFDTLTTWSPAWLATRGS